MKISNKYLISVELDSISYNVFESNLFKVYPKSVNIKLDFSCTEPLDEIIVSNLTIEDWFRAVLLNKLVLQSNYVIQRDMYNMMFGNETTTGLFEQLVVENTDTEYIMKTLVEILKTLLPKNIELISLEY